VPGLNCNHDAHDLAFLFLPLRSTRNQGRNLMAINDVYLLTVAAKATGQWVNNTFHFQQLDDGLPDPWQQAQDLCSAFQTNFQEAWLALFAVDYVLLGYRAKRVATGGGPSYTAPGGSVTGTVSDTMAMTSAVGGVLVWPYTVNEGVSWRTGRTFLPAAPESYVVENALTDAYLAAIAAVGALFVDPLEGAESTYQFGIYAKKPAVAFYDVEEFAISGGLGFQRRRAAPVLGKPSRSSHHRRHV